MIISATDDSLFAALDLKTSRVISQFQPPASVGGVPQGFLDVIETQVPDDLDVHLVLDNYGTSQDSDHSELAGKAPTVPCPLHADIRIMVESGRAAGLPNSPTNAFGVVHSAASGNWNLRFASLSKRTTKIQALFWTRTADQILDSIARYARRTLKAHPADLFHEPLGQETSARRECRDGVRR